MGFGELRSEEIYDAVVDDGAFAALPAQLAQAFDARSAMVHWVHTDGSASILSHSGYFSDDQLNLYARRYVSLDPWVEAAAIGQAPNVALNLEDLVPVRSFTRSAFYNEYVRGIGDDTCRGIGIRVQNNWGSGYIALQRGLGQSSFEEDAVEALRHYAKHLTRMLSVRGSLLAAKDKEHGLEAALDTLADAIFLLGENGIIIHANQSAREMLHQCAHLLVRGRALRARSPAADSALRSAIARASDRSFSEAMAVSIPVSMGRSITLSVAPVRSPKGARQVLVTTKSLHHTEHGVKSRLRALYQLSSREADVAIALADGGSVDDIAEARGVSVGTVRVQIKSIAQKLGCHRQSDIVGRVKDLPSLRTE